jgi:hypothetical protein
VPGWRKKVWSSFMMALRNLLAKVCV